VVDATPDGKIVCSGVGKIAVVLEGGRGNKAVLFENLVVVPVYGCVYVLTLAPPPPRV
jgi:hypothetical protein